MKEQYKGLQYQHYWDDLICLYHSNQTLMIINYQGKLIKQIELKQIFIDFYCCQDPRFIILQFEQKEFAILDLLENQQQIYKGEIIGQKDNKILFNRDGNYYIMSINDKTISQIKQKMDYIAWVGKLIIAEKDEFLVFNTLNNKHIKILLKPYTTISSKNNFPQQQNDLILSTLRKRYFDQFQHLIVHIQKLNRTIKIIRKIKANIPWPYIYKKCQVSRQFVIIRIKTQLNVINIMKATYQNIPIKSDQFFILKNDRLQILESSNEGFVINKQYKL